MGNRIKRSLLLGLATLSACATEPAEPAATTDQTVINRPLPGNLNLMLNAKTSITIGPFTQVFGDIASSGAAGSLLFDVSANQGFNNSALASKVTVRTNASAGHVFGNDLIIDGFAAQTSLGLDPSALPAVPAATAATAGTTNLTVAQNQARQLCPGQYGVISVGAHGTLNLNGGVYQVSRLSLAEGARLEPSEPVVILVTGTLTTGVGAILRPSSQALNPMTARDIRIEVGGAVTIGDSSELHIHLLAPSSNVKTGKLVTFAGAAWAKSIAIGAQNSLVSDGVFTAQAPQVPPPCNDNNACTTDVCVGSGNAVAFCRNTPVAVGTSCGDDNLCNGAELCNAAGQCASGAQAPAGTSCTDDDACNGDETCNGAGTCTPGAPPVVSDNNTCTADACDADTGVSHIPLPDGTACGGTGVCQAGVCSVTARTLVMINDFTGRLERLDPDTLAVTDVGSLGVPYAFGDCAFNPTDGALYMVDGRAQNALFRVSLTTGAATLVGFHGLGDVFSLAYHPPTNQLYAIDGNGALYTLSTATGAATFVGQPFFGFVDGLAFDSTRNTLIALTAGSATFFAVDVTTATATPLNQVGFVNDLGLTYDAQIDRFWAADFNGRIIQFDPNQGLTIASDQFIGGAHTCLAAVPVQ